MGTYFENHFLTDPSNDSKSKAKISQNCLLPILLYEGAIIL